MQKNECDLEEKIMEITQLELQITREKKKGYPDTGSTEGPKQHKP